MTPKHRRFIAEYLTDLNATQAAIRSGYSRKTAGSQAFDLLKKPEIAAEVARLQAQHLDDAGLTATRVREEIARLAFSDIRRLFDARGNLRPIHELTEAEAAVLAGVEVLKKNVTSGDGLVDTLYKVKIWDKPKALEMAAKHLGMYDDSARLEGEFILRWGTDGDDR